MAITFTRKGYIRLFRDGVQISQHTSAEEAYESAIAHAEANGPGKYRVTYPDRELDVWYHTIRSGAPASGSEESVPDISQLPDALREVGDWNNFPGTGWAVNAAFVDVTGVTLRRITNATSPLTNDGINFEYSTGGPRISRPFGAGLDTYHIAVHISVGASEYIRIMDVQRGVGYVTGSYVTTPGLPNGILGYCWSSKSSEPHILYFSDKDSPDLIHRYDVDADDYAPNAVFSGTDASISAGGNIAGWLTQSWDGTRMCWTTPTADPTTLHYLHIDTGVHVTYNNATAMQYINDVRMVKGSGNAVVAAAYANPIGNGGVEDAAAQWNNDSNIMVWFPDTNRMTSYASAVGTRGGHSDCGASTHYALDPDGSYNVLAVQTVGTTPASDLGAWNGTRTDRYDSGSANRIINSDYHPCMSWDQTGAGTSEYFFFEVDPGSSGSNDATSANSWSVYSGSVYQTAVTFGGGLSSVDGIIVKNGSGNFIGHLDAVGSLGAVVAGTFYWSGTTLYAQMADSSSPATKTRLVAAAKIYESLGFAKQDGTVVKKLCYTYRNENTYSYSNTPFANQSPDGKIVIFGSNLGVDNGPISLIMAEVPVS